MKTTFYTANPPGFIVPAGYRWTGAIRKPVIGEIYLDHDGIWVATRDFQNNEWPICVAAPVFKA